jgi:hypothetical protein
MAHPPVPQVNGRRQDWGQPEPHADLRQAAVPECRAVSLLHTIIYTITSHTSDIDQVTVPHTHTRACTHESSLVAHLDQRDSQLGRHKRGLHSIHLHVWQAG